MRLRPRTLRGRLTLVFAVVTAVLCLLVGFLVDFEYRRALRDALDNGLVTRFDNLQRDLAASGDLAVEPSLPDAEAFAQIIGADGEVVNAAPRVLLARSVLTKSEVAEARRHQITIERSAVPGAPRSRLLAGPAGQQGLGLVVVVGTSLQEAIEAQQRLELVLVIGLPLLAVVVSAAGWFLARAALTPVRDLVEEAEKLSAVAARGRGRRLSVPQSGEELADLARHLNELLARIEGALEHERAFLDDASHELRTPISITRSELELARMQADDGSDVARALDSALEEVDRLDRLAVNLLVLARTRSAGPPPPHAVELGELSRRAVDAVSRSRDTDSVVLDVSGSAEVRGDEDAIERAVLNLVDNAAHHAHRRVDVTVSSDGDQAVVAVRDDGPGFPPELLDQAAGRFVRGSSMESGAGLGLAIVDAIAAAHGGGIVIRNRSEGGADVQLRLPLGRSSGQSFEQS
ncbi:MAG: ATP-binding protein [Actinomycetota bacterium]|nr:ATP-binding protein [Actinomycetota bacterium]